jgi:hypothetical protein
MCIDSIRWTVERQRLSFIRPPRTHSRSTSLTSCTGTSLNIASYLARPTVQVACAPAAEPPLADPLRSSHYGREGGPILLAKLTSKWSHVAGRRHSRNKFAESGNRCRAAIAVE